MLANLFVFLDSDKSSVEVQFVLNLFLFHAVLEILQLVKKRDLFLADIHILELEQECNESAAPVETEDANGPPTGLSGPSASLSPGAKDGGRRKAKDVELLYEELQKELWAVVRESLRSPTSGPNLGLVVQVRTAAIATKTN